jgi:hypothetical protein
MSVTFRSTIKWPNNDLLLPAELYNVTVPPGLSSIYVRVPNSVDMNKMMQLARDPGSSLSGNLTMTEGLVTADLKVRFPNPAAQWRKSSPPSIRDSSHGPIQFQFTGGDVFLDLTLGIYLLDTADVDPNDDLSVQIFACIYEHELLHVLDDVDLINNWLPPRLNPEPTLARYLVRGDTYLYGTPSMGASQIEQEFRTFITNTIQVAIFNLWATKRNRRKQLRDSPANYQIVSDKVNDLRARQINRPHR